MKKFLFGFIGIVVLAIVLYFTAVYYMTYSEGYRSGQLVKVSYKGLVFKTWEGQLSQGVSDGQVFRFSIEDNEERVIKLLQDYQGSNVRLKFKERFATFAWWGDTKYFVVDVEKVDEIEQNNKSLHD
ncbi:6-phosphogluconate dehydrogenase [Flavicella marina]|uniref:6-phosphogluconate dehydrogenase n=1 Tax=Flavicella marina TaxID=1475951 RepID=UPI00126424AE|nr:6-phosphogluconate dehydrogenase [Flavicella marina]